MNERLVKVEPPGRRAAIALAVAVHLLLAGFLIYGVQWQSPPPEAVQVDLVRAAPAPAAEAPPPEPQPVPPPEPKPAPAPKPEPKPLPPPKAPDIAVKEKEKPKPPPKVEPKPATARFDPSEMLKRDEKEVAARREREAAEQELTRLGAAAATSARNKVIADYVAKIKGKIRGNIVMPPEMKSNPEAVFEVTQLPSGEILSVKLKKPSGNPAWDSATERAILKSSPLPKPDSNDAFNRNLELKFRPQED